MPNWKDISIPGYRIVAQALLSRGALTAPRSAFVAIREPDTDENAEAIAAEWNHQTGGWGYSHYTDTVGDAYGWFAGRVQKDAERYLNEGVPLTVAGEA